MTFEARRRIGYMPEERGLYPKVRLAEQLAAAGLDPASVAAEVAGAGPGAEPSATQPAAQPGDPGGLRRRVHLHVLAQLLRCLRGPGGGRGKGNPDRRDRAGHGPPRPAACRQIIGIGLVGLFQLAIIGATAFVLISLTHVVPVPAVGAGAIAVDLARSLARLLPARGHVRGWRGDRVTPGRDRERDRPADPPFFVPPGECRDARPGQHDEHGALVVASLRAGAHDGPPGGG